MARNVTREFIAWTQTRCIAWLLSEVIKCAKLSAVGNTHVFDAAIGRSPYAIVLPLKLNAAFDWAFGKLSDIEALLSCTHQYTPQTAVWIVQVNGVGQLKYAVELVRVATLSWGVQWCVARTGIETIAAYMLENGAAVGFDNGGQKRFIAKTVPWSQKFKLTITNENALDPICTTRT